jgi:cation diffusion facilitator family transporter
VKHRPASFYAWLSVATSVVTITLKFWAYLVTDSVGLLSDAIESLVNIVAALVALTVLYYVAVGPDDDHNFGHDKAEYFSSGIEGGLIFAAAIGIIWSAIPRLIEPRAIEQITLGIVLTVAASAANALCAWVMLRAAKVHRSITLEADAHHLLTDVWTSAGVLAGIVIASATGWSRLDPIVAIAVAVNIVWIGWSLIRRSFDGLMDRAIPAKEHARLVELLERYKAQGCDYHQLRTRQSGKRSFIDVHLLVAGTTSVLDGHDVVERFEAETRALLPHVEVLTHLEPIEDPRSYEAAHGPHKRSGTADIRGS